MDVVNEWLVRRAIAAHLEMAQDEIEAQQSLEDDLGLDPLDLVLITLRLEEDVGVEFPVALLETVKTVGDLEDLVRSWLAVVPTLLRAMARVPARLAIRERVEAGFHGY
ncbi:MAG: hypothetical protein JST00_02020 [Deltaproteobacteria bacterium]|nr:hypothetical protein [Deltaproteobacteria bacterium]